MNINDIYAITFWDMWCNSASRTLQDETTLTRHICAARRYSFLTALRSTARAAGPATSGRGLGGERHVSRRFMSFRIFVKNMSLKVNWQLFFDHENQWGFVRGIWEVQIVGIERIWSISFWKADSKGESWDVFRFSLENWWMPSWKAVFGVWNAADFPVATSSKIFRA